MIVAMNPEINHGGVSARNAITAAPPKAAMSGANLPGTSKPAVAVIRIIRDDKMTIIDIAAHKTVILTRGIRTGNLRSGIGTSGNPVASATVMPAAAGMNADMAPSASKVTTEVPRSKEGTTIVAGRSITRIMATSLGGENPDAVAGPEITARNTRMITIRGKAAETTSPGTRTILEVTKTAVATTSEVDRIVGMRGITANARLSRNIPVADVVDLRRWSPNNDAKWRHVVVAPVIATGEVQRVPAHFGHPSP